MEETRTPSARADFLIEKVERDSGYEMHTFHLHRRYEIYYEIEGMRRYFIEGAAYLANAGDVVLIGENQIHKTGLVEEESGCHFALAFSGAYLRELRQAFPQVDFVGFLSGNTTHLLRALSAQQQEQVCAAMQRLLTLQSSDSPDSAAACKMILGTLLLRLKELCRRQEERGAGDGRVTNRTVDQIQGYIALHYAEKLTLTDIARQFYISPYYLSRLFKKTTSLSLIEYINGVRVKAAQNLMERTADSVSAIAAATGFTTPTHFRRVFKEATGLSPQQYRQRCRRLRAEKEQDSPGPRPPRTPQ